MSEARQNIRIQQWVAILSIGLFAIKATAYFITHSVAILTDALEGIVNIVAGLIGLYSLTLSAKPRDEDHPYGHGKIEFVSAGLEGSMILIAGVFIIYHAIENLIDPRPLQKLDLGMLLVCITAVMNYSMGAICLRIGKRNNSLALQASGRHLQSDTYTTIGVVIGLLIVYVTNIQWFDSVTAILFALLIIYTGWRIIRKSLAGIMDETDDALLRSLVEFLNEHRRDNWMDLHNLRIIKYGNVLHIDCHLTVPWYFNVHEAHLESEEFTRLVQQQFGDSVELYIHTDACLESQCKICSKHDCPVRQHEVKRKIAWNVENISSNKKHDEFTDQ
jgi:cation diffusion facilitator family transporter